MSRELQKARLIETLENVVRLLRKESVELKSAAGEINVSFDVDPVEIPGGGWVDYVRTGKGAININQHIVLFDQEIANEEKWVDVTTVNGYAKGKKAILNTKTGEEKEVDWRR